LVHPIFFKKEYDMTKLVVRKLDTPNKTKHLLNAKIKKLIGEVNGYWGATWSAYIATGNKLVQLEKEMKKQGVTSGDVENFLPWNWQYARRMMKASQWEGLKDPKIRNRIPHVGSTIYTLSGLTKTQLNVALKSKCKRLDERGKWYEDDLISPDMKREEITTWRKEYNLLSTGKKGKKSKQSGMGKEFTITIEVHKEITRTHFDKKVRELKKAVKGVKEASFKCELDTNDCLNQFSTLFDK
jgi:hypothetical protein